MDSLTISVLALAAIAIVVVAGYNLWLARLRAPRPRPTETVRETANPAGGERAEPSLGLDPAGAADARAPLESADAPAQGQTAARAPAPVLDAYTDCIVELVPLAPVTGERLITLMRGLRRAGSKPIAVEALERGRDAIAVRPAAMAAADTAGGVDPDLAGADAAAAMPAPAPDARETPMAAWRAPAAGGHYDAVRVGVLLANRHGPLNAMEFTEFVGGVQTLAEQLSVLADTPDMSAVLARARALDELCASLDAQLGIGVETGEPLGVADLARLAAETGCVERGNNRYARLGPGGEVLFSLALADAPNRLSLLLDVPRAPAAQAPWREMVACARLCAQRLGGSVVDDAGRPLPDAQIDRIEQQIAARLQSLDDAGFPAGAPLTLRLFN